MEKLYEDDCISVMQCLPNDSIDMIFADPLFNIGKKCGGKASNDKWDDRRSLHPPGA